MSRPTLESARDLPCIVGLGQTQAWVWPRPSRHGGSGQDPMLGLVETCGGSSRDPARSSISISSLAKKKKKHSLKRIAASTSITNQFQTFSSTIPKHHSRDSSNKPSSSSAGRNSKNPNDQWNDSWDMAWLPEDLSPKHRAPCETDVNFPPWTKAFVEDMNENWNQRRGSKAKQQDKQQRLKKQRIHTGLWVKEIEKQEEAKLGDSITGSWSQFFLSFSLPRQFVRLCKCSNSLTQYTYSMIISLFCTI
ncbi:uncharacterized protein LOC132178173 [Corylus avellana]|uniref:uncharacterized protein LOC132178173 n=1 Tax=Corylus avellana TaxID=13451 RepID=UPI00286B28A3|nr:uncharacterized protein LOC132178173 [Corylus avellana]